MMIDYIGGEKKMVNISICGINCQECNFLGKECNGCRQEKGIIFWSKPDVCPLYQCCINEKKLNNCGLCKELPCGEYFKVRDPSLSDDEFKKGIEIRVNNLKKL